CAGAPSPRVRGEGAHRIHGNPSTRISSRRMSVRPAVVRRYDGRTAPTPGTARATGAQDAELHDVSSHEPQSPASDIAGRDHGGDQGLHGLGRPHARRRQAQGRREAHLRRRQGDAAERRRKGHRHRRALCGEQGADRRLLRDQRQGLQRGVPDRRELPAPRLRRPHRGAAGRPDVTIARPLPAPADPLVDDLFRREAGKISAWLARLLGPGRLDLIEDAVQDAFSVALMRWPLDGVPERPAAWLAVAARNKALDRLRRDARLDPFDEGAALRLGFSDPGPGGRLGDTLALMFVACHPALAPDEQTMLTLKTVCGFGVKEIARAYLSTPEAVTQRLVRAKRKIGGLGLRFEIPEGPELAERLPALIQAIYLLFNGGYTSDEGDALMRREFCAEALRLVTLLTGHPATATGEAHA